MQLVLFFKQVELLKKLNVIRSDTMLGDIGEFLCTVVFDGLKLVERRTQEGYDAILNDNTVQIKYSNSSYANNVDLGEPENYELVIVVLGKNSAHLCDEDMNGNYDYYFYLYSKAEVKDNFETSKNSGSFKLAQTKHFKQSDKQYSLYSS